MTIRFKGAAGALKAVDSLVVIPHNGETAAAAAAAAIASLVGRFDEQPQQLELQRVRILKLVDQHVGVPAVHGGACLGGAAEGGCGD